MEMTYEEIEALKAQFLADNGSGKKSSVLYANKTDRLEVKLMLAPGKDEKNFWEAYENWFNGQLKGKQFLVPAIVVGGSDASLIDKDNVIYLRVPLTVIPQIMTTYQSEYRPFDNPGPVIRISNKKVAKNTEYTVTPLGKQSHDGSNAQWPEETMKEAGDRQVEVGKNSKGDADEAVPVKKTNPFAK